jgi:hypothetical protein
MKKIKMFIATTLEALKGNYMLGQKKEQIKFSFQVFKGAVNLNLNYGVEKP